MFVLSIAFKAINSMKWEFVVDLLVISFLGIDYLRRKFMAISIPSETSAFRKALRSLLPVSIESQL